MNDPSDSLLYRPRRSSGVNEMCFSKETWNRTGSRLTGHGSAILDGSDGYGSECQSDGVFDPVLSFNVAF